MAGHEDVMNALLAAVRSNGAQTSSDSASLGVLTIPNQFAGSSGFSSSSSTASPGPSAEAMQAAAAMQLQAMQELQQQYMAAYQQQVAQQTQEAAQDFWVQEQLAAQSALIMESAQAQADSNKQVWQEEQQVLEAAEDGRAARNLDPKGRQAIMEDLMRRNYKTAMCKYNNKGGCNQSKTCIFAHTYAELRLQGRHLSKEDEETIRFVASVKLNSWAKKTKGGKGLDDGNAKDTKKNWEDNYNPPEEIVSRLKSWWGANSKKESNSDWVQPFPAGAVELPDLPIPMQPAIESFGALPSTSGIPALTPAQLLAIQMQALVGGAGSLNASPSGGCNLGDVGLATPEWPAAATLPQVSPLVQPGKGDDAWQPNKKARTDGWQDWNDKSWK